MVPGVPGVLLVTNPPGVTVIAGSLLDHEPPGVASDNVVVYPVHIAVDPVIGAGKGFTVTAWIAAGHPGFLYEIVTTPGERPVTTDLKGKTESPTVTITAIVGLLLVQILSPPTPI